MTQVSSILRTNKPGDHREVEDESLSSSNPLRLDNGTANVAGCRSVGLATVLLVFLLSHPPLMGPQVHFPQSSGHISLRDSVLDWIFATDIAALKRHLPLKLAAALEKVPAERRIEISGRLSELLLQEQGLKLERHTGNSPLVTAEKGDDKYAATLLEEDVHGSDASFQIVLRRWHDGTEFVKWGFPRFFTITARLERGFWRMRSISIVGPDGLQNSYNLEDPDLIYEMTHGRVAADQRLASRAVARILAAEHQYAAAYPQVGYTCVLGDLGVSAIGIARDEHHSGLVSGDLASGGSRGYHIELTGCGDDLPHERFSVLATPDSSDGGTRVLCGDQDGGVFYYDAGTGEDCLSGRSPIASHAE